MTRPTFNTTPTRSPSLPSPTHSRRSIRAAFATGATLAALAALGGCATVQDPHAVDRLKQESSVTGATQPGAAAPALHALLDEDLARALRRSPFQATGQGLPGYDHLLPDRSAAGLEREREGERQALARLRALDVKALQGQDRISYHLLLQKMEAAVERQRFTNLDAMAFSTLGGIHTSMPSAAQLTPFREPQNFRDYIQRLRAMPAMAAQVQDLLDQGIASGWMVPVPVLERVLAALDSHLVEDASQSMLLGPFQRAAAAGAASPLAGLAAPELKALEAEALAAIRDGYQPAMRRLRQYIVGVYRPKAPAEGGLASLPEGTAYYNSLIRANLGSDLNADVIHEIGLKEVARLRAEIGGLATRAGFTGGADAYIKHMATDPRHFFKSTDAVLEAYRALAQRVDPQLPKLFHAVPKMPYAVRAMTAAEAASSTAANYRVGSLKLGTSGYFSVNALGYAHEATWGVESLFLHETVPGHHMQNARLAEMEGLHRWRLLANHHGAYSEGWALYAESLGFGMGLYKDPAQHYGHLQYELFRAARLVVDTGLHAFHWPRAKAVAYMMEHGGLPRERAASEVDRYLSSPSQALTYKIGQLKFLQLRARAEQALGAKFDLRDFHALALDNGHLSLPMLESLVDEWIAKARG